MCSAGTYCIILLYTEEFPSCHLLFVIDSAGLFIVVVYFSGKHSGSGDSGGPQVSPAFHPAPRTGVCLW